MKAILISLALFAGQAMTLQQKRVVHLRPNSATIEASFGGSLLELSQAPPEVSLPPVPPQQDASGNPWVVDVKNFGPQAIKILGVHNFSTQVMVGQTIHIASNGRVYTVKH